MPNDHNAGWPAPRAQYPWKQGDILIADELNAAIANAAHGGAGLFLPNYLPAGQPDGATDLASYIQQAIDAAAGHGTLTIPANANAYVTGTLYIPSNTHLIIEAGATLMATATGGGLLITDDRVSRLLGANNVYIELRGTLDGNASNQTVGHTSGGITSAGVSTDIYVDGFRQGLITNFLNWPVNIVRCTNAEVRNLAMTNSGNSCEFAGITSGGVTTKCYNVGFTNCTVQDIRDIGITLYGGCESSYIRGCNLLNGASALIFLDNGQPGQNIDCEISGCFQSGGEGAIGLTSNKIGVNNRNCRVFNNTIENVHGAGLQIGGVDYCEVYGNVVHDSGVTFQNISGQNGMATISGGSHIHFHDNAIRNTTSPGYYSRHTTNTIASLVSYNPTTGAVSLTTTATHPIVVGDQFSIYNTFGSGAYLSLNGFWTATAGTSGTTVSFTGPTGLTLTALKSGSVAKYTNAVAVTIASGTYDPATGNVSLTTSAPHGMPMTAGIPQPFVVSGITGTGAVANLNGYQVATAGTAGSTINCTIATGLAAMSFTGGTILPPTFGVSTYDVDYCRINNNHIGDWQATKYMAACIGGQWGTDGYTNGNVYGPRLATGPLYGFPADAMVYSLGVGNTQGASYDSVLDIYSGALGDRNISGETFFHNRALTVGWNLSAGQGEVDLLCGQSGGGRGGFNFLQISNDGTVNASAGVSGSLLANDGFGNTRLGGALVHGAMQQTGNVLNAGTVTVNPNTSFVLVQNSTSIASASVVLPALTPSSFQSFAGGAELELNFQNPIGALTVTAAAGTSVVSPPTTIATAGTSVSFVLSGSTWRRRASDANSAAAGGPFLPLATGGTVSGATTFNARLTNAVHMTSNATDSNATINMTAVGSGVNGPSTGQFGLSINATKDGWFNGTSAVGEIDALSIMARQGGTGSDCGGMLINVVGTGTGFIAIDESVVQQQQVNTGAPLYGIRTQEGGMNPATGGRIGKYLRAEYGNLSAAIQTVNQTGMGYWGNAFVNIRDNVTNFVLDDHGSINTAGSILINSSAGGVLTVQGYDTTPAVGANLMWNQGGNGDTWLLNQKGGGTGGFVFGEVTSSGVVTARLTIDGNGNSIFDGAVKLNRALFGIVPAIVGGTSYTVSATDYTLIMAGSAAMTVTLPSAPANPGRILILRNAAAFAVNSASTNVYPFSGAALGTAILPAGPAKFVWLQSDGVNWQTMMAN